MYQDVQFQCPTEAKQKLLWLQDRNHWPNENHTTTMNAKKASEVRSALCHSMCRRENEQPCTDKKLPLFKRDSRPPTTWLGNATALQLMMWRAKDVVCFQRNYWMPHRKLEFEIGNRTPNCLRHHVWLDVSTFNKCLFTTKQGGFLLILICKTSQIFVWRNKAFIFFQKSDILSGPKNGTWAHMWYQLSPFPSSNVAICDAAPPRQHSPILRYSALLRYSVLCFTSITQCNWHDVETMVE